MDDFDRVIVHEGDKYDKKELFILFGLAVILFLALGAIYETSFLWRFWK